jgi:hypothetical protein
MFAAPGLVRVGKEGSHQIGIVGTRTADSSASRTKEDGGIMKKMFTSGKEFRGREHKERRIDNACHKFT